MKTVDGRRAEIISSMRRFTTYKAFANRHGYPDAAALHDDDDTRLRPQNGDIVTLLTSGPHGAFDDTLWIVEAANGERHIYNEKGLRILNENVTVLKDAELGGVEREYTEVKRKACVGERVKVISDKYEGDGHHNVGDVRYVIYEDRWHDGVGISVSDKYVEATNWKDGVGLNHDRYVVLTPTDVVHIDGKRYRMVKRKAAVGERITPIVGGRYYTAGKVYEVTLLSPEGESTHVHFTDNCGDRWHLAHSNYRVLEPLSGEEETPANTAYLALQLESLAEAVAKLTLKVAELEKCAKTETEDIVIDNGSARELTRDSVIERAKRDIDALKITHYPTLAQYYVARNLTWMPECDAEFIINRTKRTVVCLLRKRKRGGNGEVQARGIAKCAPGDVFNTHIGRAVSLRRALGLEVPAEYTNAPKPTEPRVGDIVEAVDYTGVTFSYEVTKVSGDKLHGYLDGYKGFTYKDGGDRYGAPCTNPVVIDDSREEVTQ